MHIALQPDDYRYPGARPSATIMTIELWLECHINPIMQRIHHITFYEAHLIGEEISKPLISLSFVSHSDNSLWYCSGLNELNHYKATLKCYTDQTAYNVSIFGLFPILMMNLDSFIRGFFIWTLVLIHFGETYCLWWTTCLLCGGSFLVYLSKQ